MNADSSSSAITLGPAAASELVLGNHRPRPNPTSGTPVESSARLFEDETVFAGIWECTPGRFPVARVTSHSFMQIISGTGDIIDSDGTRHRLEPGSIHVEPDEWQGEWEITETVRKFYVIHKTA
jgi:uncharacterized protein